MGTMDAEEYRCKARHYLTLARQMSEPVARAALVDIAAYWNDWADRLEASQRALQQQVTAEQAPPLVPAH
jgi:hypothetical protein